MVQPFKHLMTTPPKRPKEVSKFVAVQMDGEVTIHIPGASSDYHTLCGIDAYDDSVGHEGTVPVPRGAKIDCPQCFAIWLETRNIRKTDFNVQE